MGLKKASLLSEQDEEEGTEEVFVSYEDAIRILAYEIVAAEKEIDSLNCEMADHEFEFDIVIMSLEGILSAGKDAYQQGTLTPSEVLARIVKDIRELIKIHKKF